MIKQPKFIPDVQNVSVRSRGYLPHWEMADATYSMTYRLHDSLPKSVLRALMAEYRAMIGHEADATAAERAESRLAFERSVDRSLDCGHGESFMADPCVAEVVVNNLLHFEHDSYVLHAWCVMPNHVHVVMRTLGAQSLARIVHSWKSYTSKRANAILEREGPFWAREYFDRIVRNEDDLRSTMDYVVSNPAKARLKGWPWVWRTGEPPVDRPASGRRSS